MKTRLLLTPFTLVASVFTPAMGFSCSKNVKIETITLTLSKQQVDVGDEVKLNVKVLPENASKKDVEISISNSNNFYKNNSNLIVPYKPGTYTITATAKDGSGKVDSKTLTVNPEETTTESWIDYANDRTFSLKINAHGISSSCFGTGWILSDATPNNYDDYEYYVATNWHVVNGITSSKLNFAIGCGEDGDYISLDEYINVEGTLMDEDNFLHGDTIDIEIEGKVINALQCCDFYVVKMNLEDVLTSQSSCSHIIENKLEKLNNLTRQGKKITNIAPIVNESNNFSSIREFYTLGYPKGENPFAKRESHSFEQENIRLEYSANSYHEIPKKSLKYNKVLVDCSPQYVSQKEVLTTWMNGGASGSMLLADFGSDNEHIYKVCGIYWGVFEGKNGDLPSYSIFNSEYKNFASNFY